MADTIRTVIENSQKAEHQLMLSTKLLNAEISKRDEETRRAEALFKLFQEKRFVDDVKNGRVCQPPIFYEAWNNNIGRITQFVDGADLSAFPQMYRSYQNTIESRTNAHREELLKVLK